MHLVIGGAPGPAFHNQERTVPGLVCTVRDVRPCFVDRERGIRGVALTVPAFGQVISLWHRPFQSRICIFLVRNCVSLVRNRSLVITNDPPSGGFCRSRNRVGSGCKKGADTSPQRGGESAHADRVFRPRSPLRQTGKLDPTNSCIQRGGTVVARWSPTAG